MKCVPCFHFAYSFQIPLLLYPTGPQMLDVLETVLWIIRS